jgi:hypothetical protein
VAGAKFPVSFQLKLGGKKMKNLILVFVVAFAFSTTAMAADIAISTQAGWFSQAAADREMQEIVDNVTAVSVEQFTADQQDALADWVVAHTGDGVSDLLILCGQFPDTIYAPGNAQADDSLAELFLDDGNTIVNTGDYMFYVVNSSGANAAGGLQTMMDIAGITMWDDNTSVAVTTEGRAVAPSLQDYQTDRPFHLDELEGDWVPELILAQNDAGTRADPVIVVNTATGGRLGIFYQTSGQDGDPRGEVISEWINNYFLTAGEIPNSPAWKPNPEDGAVDVDALTLEWAAGYGAVTHTVYLSTDETIDDADLAGETAVALIAATMEPATTYYWRVDEVDADGNVVEGSLWSFTTLPLEAHFPSPADGAIWRRVDSKLSWTPGKNAIMHNVSFGTDPAVLLPVSMMQMDTSYDPGPLQPATTYYWKVDEFTPIGTIEGPVWSFTTLDPDVGGCAAEYWSNMTLSGAPDVVTTESEVNFDFNAQRGSQPHPDVPVTDRFSCRWTAELQVPVTGTYTLYEASDDGSRMFLNGEQIAAGWWDRGTTEDTTGPLELVAGERYLLVMEMYENGGGATAYLRWEGPGIPKEIIPQGALMPPQMAFSLTPSNGSIDVDSLPTLTWLAGDTAVAYDVYFGKDEALVAASDASMLAGQQAENSFVPADPLGRGTTLYWKVDVVTADGTIIPGLVSSFRVADENTDNWAVSVSAAEPDYLDTFVQDGVYDIGALSGDISYEFVVRSNPDEQEGSMCLIGRRNYGDPRVGLKYEQWQNTGTYGATLFGVVDLDYGVPTAPGEYTHLVFVSSEDAGTTELYVNGVLEGSVDRAITLSGLVGIGYLAEAEDGSAFADNFDGDVFGVAIYDRALSADEIAANADKYFNPIAITDPDLLIYYDFESGSGRTAIDRSGHSNHGLFMGNPEWATGIFGGCISIDIADLDYIQTGAPLNIVSNTVSVTGWVKHDESPAAWSGILTHRGTSPGCLGLQHNGTELRYMWGADVYWSFSSGLEMPNGEWYFAALTISPDQGKLYLNGIEQTATNVAPHEPTNFDSLIRVGRDHNDDRIMTSLIDEVRFYNRTLTDVDIQRLVLPDVTAPGDIVKGVPDDGDWPGAETPDLAVDDDVNRKYLHFKGGSMATGFVVTPLAGPSIVTGMTFTTANDVPTRDPITFELSGSNESIDGPYELIASGDIVDFALEADWPRFTMNTTPISFDNDVAYKHYQVLFPTLRGPTEGLMQIGEVELLGVGVPEIVFAEDFESYAAGSDLHGQAGWKGWDNDAAYGAPASDAFAVSGLNSVEIIGSADLVHEFDLAGGMLEFSAMQYIPSGTTGTTYFILLNTYSDGGSKDWSIQTTFDLAAGNIGFWHGGGATILYDQWVELKYIIDLDNNTVDKYYNGELIVTDQWDDNVHGTLQCIDLFGNNASSVYYDDITVTRP